MGKGVSCVGGFEASPKMELLGPEYIAVEDLIECEGGRPVQYRNHEKSLKIVG